MAFAQKDGGGFEPALQKVMNLRGALVVNLEAAQPGAAFQVNLPIGNQVFTLDVSPFSVRDPDYTLWEQQADGSWLQLDPGPINTFRGSVVGIPGSVVAGGVMDNGMSARILVDDTTEYWIEPIFGKIDGAPKGAHVIYTHDNLIQGDWRCGNTEKPVGHDHVGSGHAGGDGPSGRGATLDVAQIACDADWPFFQRYGGSTNVQSRIATVINTMNVAYERDVNITHVITTTLTRGSAAADPYSTTDPATLNVQIETEWNGQGAITKDVIQLFTGREIDGNVIGRANHIGAICTAGGDPNCFAQSDFNNNFMSACDLSMHELGHLWDAVHCSCSNPASTMNPSITSINRFTFSNDQDNIGQIVAYRNSRGCLGTAAGSAPPNNDCTDAVVISTGRFGFNNNGATTDGPAACGSIGDDIWYTFRPQCDGTITVDTCNNANEVGFDTVLALYSGGCGSLTELACNDDDGGCTVSNPPRRSFITAALQAQQVYRIRVGGFAGANGSGILHVTYTACPEVPNDTCDNAITVTTCDSPISYSTENADSDGTIEVNDCNFSGSSQIFNDIWYRVVAPCSGTMRASTCGANFDSKIAIYLSCPSGANGALRCNDDNGPACAGLDASVDFPVVGGNDYFIRVGSFSQTAFGSGSLSIESLSCPIPSNDLCSNPSPVSVGLNDINNVNSCANAGSSCGSGSAAVYYSFTAPDSCTYQVETCGLATWDTVLAVYPNCLVQPPIACSDDNCGGTLQSSLSFAATGGTSYLIRLHGFSGATGTGQMRISRIGPSNDECAGAQVVGLGSTAITNACSSANAGAGCGSGNAAVYFSFTSPVTAALNIDTCLDGRTFDTVIGVYANCGAGAPIVCNDDFCGLGTRLVLNATSGTNYIIRVHGFGGATGVATLRIGPDNDDCENAIAIINGSNTISINGATQSGPNIGCLVPFADVWMSYNATCSGAVTIDTCGAGTTFDTVLSAYRGLACPVTAARNVACNDDSCGLRSSITFNAVAGQNYLVRLSNFSNNPVGTANVTVACVAANCPCDFNHNGVLNSQDFFDFLACFFTNGCLAADYNNSGAVNSQDFFDFLTCFFAPPAGCN
jgi:hypothetical protein